MIKKAMILAAGFGKRMHPLTLDCPKPLLKIHEETLLSNTITFLQKIGVEKIVINVHYLASQIIKYIDKKKFNVEIIIEEEKDNILDTGGGILNVLNHFLKEPFITINPDTLWNSDYLKEFKLMEKVFFSNKDNGCCMLVVSKEKSFDKSLKGDFNLEKNLINRKKNDLKYIYTGLQIIRPEVFLNSKKKIFSINKIWNILIENNKLCGIKSNINFLHVNNISVYKDLIDKDFKH